MEEKSFINCHTHTFTGDHVPRQLGKKLLPAPLGKIFTITMIVDFFRWWYKGPYRWRFSKLYISTKTFIHEIRLACRRNFVLRTLIILASVILTIDGLLILYHWVLIWFVPENSWPGSIEKFRSFLKMWWLLPADEQSFLQLLIFVFVLVLVPSGRNLLLFLLKLIPRFFKLLPGSKTKEFILRYLSIGRFTFHGQQGTIFKDLRVQYPLDTKFVILPMDMDFIDAGTPRKNYLLQLQELRELRNKNKETALPFVFADPRRIVQDPAYEKVVKDCIEKEGFHGIKTYPALGYYPFDKDLLPLMLYACENEIPVLNHCIKGVIFYRGNKKPEWDRHPLFIQSTGEKEKFESLQLFQQKNIDFSPNFTHPLNYLCLLDEKRLRQLLILYNDDNLFRLYGYTDATTPLKRNLENLKICFGHFGGEDEWARYLESDRFIQDNSLMFHPDRGIDFIKDSALEGIWKHASWYTIIYSLMLQYKNVYADISYILHDPNTFHLLRTTLMEKSGIADRVLFGTDFYVVRSQKSDKQLWTDIVGSLTERELKLLAIDNPRMFLKNKITGNISEAKQAILD
jgi:predicted TIM-barrel fold metal-dependent hydrolase